MPVLDAVLLFLAGFVAGAVNAVAGGGTFVTFGALSLVGIPPIAANATSAITQFPGYITSTLAYRDDIRLIGRGALTLALVSAVGALAGALSCWPSTTRPFAPSCRGCSSPRPRSSPPDPG